MKSSTTCKIDRHNKNGRRLCLILALFYLLASCGATSTGNPTQPAPLPIPAQATLHFDFSKFTGDNDSSALHLATNPGSHYNLAKLFLMFSNFQVLTYTVIPAVSLGVAVTQTPTRQDEKTWLWSYNFAKSNISYSAELTGHQSETTTDWQMNITKFPNDENSCCDKFLWISGSQDGTTGTWIINDPAKPTEPTRIARVEWLYLSPTNKKLTLINLQENEKNGFLQFSRNGNTNDVTFDQDPNVDGTVHITWDENTLAGTMTGENGIKICWDQNKQNVLCSE